MRIQSFSSDLWSRDMSALASGDRETATDLLLFAALELGCRPYHRDSKSDATSDRQTLFKHPATGHVCFVLSVVPTAGDPEPYRLRVDVFDKLENIVVPFAEVRRAPRTQFKTKGERRFFVSSDISREALHAVINNVVWIGK
jgi:hypothetical protein